MKRKLFGIGLIVFLVLAAALGGYISVRYYSIVFARTVRGPIVAIERVTQPSAIIANVNPSGTSPSGTIMSHPRAVTTSAELFSFAVAIRDLKPDKSGKASGDPEFPRGEIVTASSEDRQWAVAQKGLCAEAKFFPSPPWQLDRAGTYFGARLLRLYECSLDERSAEAAAEASATAPLPAPGTSATSPTPGVATPQGNPTAPATKGKTP